MRINHVARYDQAFEHLGGSNQIAYAQRGKEHFAKGSKKELVRLRASQINGCAYCVDMHSLDARAGGETEQRLYALPVWRETPFFSERERAALLWTEKLTLISVDHVPDEVFEQVHQHFGEEELANLTLLIATINAWNRFGISFRAVPGNYKP